MPRSAIWLPRDETPNSLSPSNRSGNIISRVSGFESSSDMAAASEVARVQRRNARGAVSIIGCVKPIRTDFKSYEGKYVATDTRTGQVVIADEDLKAVLEEARNLDHVVVGGRVPHADEPICVGLG